MLWCDGVKRDSIQVLRDSLQMNRQSLTNPQLDAHNRTSLRAKIAWQKKELKELIEQRRDVERILDVIKSQGP